MSSNEHVAATTASPAMTPLKGAGVVVLIALGVAGYLGLTYSQGVVEEAWSGFLLLLYWAGIEQLNPEKLKAVLVGAFVGLSTAALLFLLPAWLGPLGQLAFLGVIIALVYCQVMGWLLTAVNMTTMLFLTVGTIPLIQTQASAGYFIGVFHALVLAIIYFGSLIGAGFWLAQRLKRTPLPE